MTLPPANRAEVRQVQVAVRDLVQDLVLSGETVTQAKRTVQAALDALLVAESIESTGEAQ